MGLSVTIGVEEHEVFCLVSASFRPPQQVMEMPSRQCGDFLVTDGTEPLLFFPDRQKLPSSLEALNHLDAEALVEVEFPCWVVQVRFCLDFLVPLDRHSGCFKQPDLLQGAIFRDDRSLENPVTGFLGGKYFFFTHLARLLGCRLFAQAQIVWNIAWSTD